MTLSTSAINRHCKKIMMLYCGITILTVIFALIYEMFSHEVFSWYMMGAFLFPLVLGVIPFFAIGKMHTIFPSLFSIDLYHSGIATLTFGSIIEGILEIYGTTNRLIIVYWIAGFALVCFGIICYALQLTHLKRQKA